ncbi:MAG TPA: RsmE family RNA methyltransferase, partial [bacterium]|nr:RsmE family RNA methyltransferase [bacterium]
VQSTEYELALNQTDAIPVTAKILSRREKSKTHTGNWIVLAQSLPKGPKIDLILRQGTEAGVNRFIPLVTQRSISRPDESQFEHKNNRWQKILVEACRQCGRNDLPQLDEVTDWKRCLELFGEFDQVLLPYEKEAPTLKTVLESNNTAQKILVLVGPEGGWSKDEVQEAQLRGAAAVHLPTPILRTETAGLAIVSMIQYALSHP